MPDEDEDARHRREEAERRAKRKVSYEVMMDSVDETRRHRSRIA